MGMRNSGQWKWSSLRIVENGSRNSQEWKWKRSRMEVFKYGSVMALLGHRTGLSADNHSSTAALDAFSTVFEPPLEGF